MAKISDYLMINEAAEFLGVSKDTLRRWDRARKLKARRHPVSNFRLYLRSDLDEFLARLGGRTAKPSGSSKKKSRRTR